MRGAGWRMESLLHRESQVPGKGLQRQKQKQTPLFLHCGAVVIWETKHFLIWWSNYCTWIFLTPV